jgi:hypothetical protein
MATTNARSRIAASISAVAKICDNAAISVKPRARMPGIGGASCVPTATRMTNRTAKGRPKMNRT